MEKNCIVSVVITVYNGEPYLTQAIESVLEQTYRPIEIIVVDDGSTDETASIAKQYHNQVRYVRQNNLGAGAARNLGVELTQGLFLAFLDADDLWVTEKLTWQMAVLASDQSVDTVFGHVQQFVSPEVSHERAKQLNQFVEIIPGYHAGSMLIKREAFQRVGKFTTNFELGEFLDWYSRGMDLGLTMRMLPEIVMRRRIHNTNQSLCKREHRVDYARFVKTVLDRRRKMKTSTLTDTDKI
jgi:glycosyltransferase involved in cell wall biosynthesis